MPSSCVCRYRNAPISEWYLNFTFIDYNKPREECLVIFVSRKSRIHDCFAETFDLSPLHILLCISGIHDASENGDKWRNARTKIQICFSGGWNIDIVDTRDVRLYNAHTYWIYIHILFYTYIFYVHLYTYTLYESEEFDSKLVTATRDDDGDDGDETVNIVLTLVRRDVHHKRYKIFNMRRGDHPSHT